MKIMKNIKLSIFIFVIVITSSIGAGPTWAANPSAVKVDGYVTDQASLLRPEEKNELNSLLSDFDQKTSNQFLVVILPSLPPGENLELYSLKMAEASRAGKKGMDNGLLLLILKEDRKIRVEVGTGLEEKITDGRAGRVIREVIAPAFQEGKYFSGIKKALFTLINWVEPSYFPEGSEGARFQEENEPGFLFFLTLFILFIIISTYLSRLDRRRWYKRGFSQRTMRPVIYPSSRTRSNRSSGSSRSFGGGGFSGGGGGFRGGGASGGW